MPVPSSEIQEFRHQYLDCSWRSLVITNVVFSLICPDAALKQLAFLQAAQLVQNSLLGIAFTEPDRAFIVGILLPAAQLS